jgi:hypothetical protein
MAVVTYILVSATDGAHYVDFGLDATEESSFGVRMWLRKTGQRLFDWMQSRGIGFISFMGDEIWKHNSDDVDRCSFYGEKKDFVVGLVFNEQGGDIKLMDSMGIHSDGTWVVDSIEIPATQNYPNGMYSKIPAGKFVHREGVLQAEFLRNMKTSSITAKPLEALSGEPLRGYAAYMVLRNTSTERVALFRVDINATTGR